MPSGGPLLFSPVSACELSITALSKQRSPVHSSCALQAAINQYYSAFKHTAAMADSFKNAMINRSLGDIKNVRSSTRHTFDTT
jgi:hypothetical protein